jgi:hypothetical protein
MLTLQLLSLVFRPGPRLRSAIRRVQVQGCPRDLCRLHERHVCYDRLEEGHPRQGRQGRPGEVYRQVR